MRNMIKMLLLATCALAAAACGNGGAESTGGSGGTGGTTTSTVNGEVFDFETDPETAVGGATVTVVGTSISDTTNASGQFELPNVPNGQQFFRAESTGYWGSVDIADVPGETVGYVLGLLPDQLLTGLADELQRTFDQGKGGVLITFEDVVGGEGGTISASSDLPFTFDVNEDPIVQDTVIADEDGDGVLIFTNVSPGNITASVTGAAGQTTCEIDEDPGTTYPVFAKSITIVYAFCTDTQ